MYITGIEADKIDTIDDEMSLFSQVVIFFIIPIMCYFIGILFRHRFFRDDSDPSLGTQLAMGVFGTFFIVLPISGVSSVALTSSATPTTLAEITAYVVSMGVIMERGLLVHESISKRIDTARNAN